MPYALKALIALLICCLTCCLHLAAQDDDLKDFKGFQTQSQFHKRAVIRTSLLPIFEGQIDFTGELRITYEQTIARRQSITIGASYDFPNFILLAITGGGGGGGRGRGGYGGGLRGLARYDIEGGRIALGYRYYISKKRTAPEGFYAGPYFSYNGVQIREKQNPANYEGVNYLNADGIAGYQFIGKRHFSFDIFFGMGYKDNFVTNYNAIADRPYYDYVPRLLPAFKNFKFLMQMNFGYAF
jgi:hypothetical protein